MDADEQLHFDVQFIVKRVTSWPRYRRAWTISRPVASRASHRAPAVVELAFPQRAADAGAFEARAAAASVTRPLPNERRC
jgi:hypothetical protein